MALFVSDIIPQIFPTIRPYLDEATQQMQPLLQKILPDHLQARKIVKNYSGKAMGTLVYSFASLCYSKAKHSPPSPEEKKAITGVSLISLSSSMFDDAIDEDIGKFERSYLFAVADLCRLTGMLEVHNADIPPKVKEQLIQVVEQFYHASWSSNLKDQQPNPEPDQAGCENALDMIGLPVEAGARVGLVLAAAADEGLAHAARLFGQSVALIDDMMDILPDLEQGFTTRYPLYFAIKRDPTISGLLNNKKYKAVYKAVLRTDSIELCRELLKKLEEAKQAGLFDDTKGVILAKKAIGSIPV